MMLCLDENFNLPIILYCDNTILILIFRLQIYLTEIERAQGLLAMF